MDNVLGIALESENRFQIGRLAHGLAAGYYAFAVSQHVAMDPRAIQFLPPSEAPGLNPTGKIARRDGSAHVLDMRFYLDLIREDHALQTDVLRSWAAGSLIRLGDALQEHKYFDHAPILELVYHLRNGVAHGNKFNFTKTGLERLVKYPAHNRDAIPRSPLGTTFEITAQSSGAILFDFMGPADIIDLLQAVEIHLTR